MASLVLKLFEKINKVIFFKQGIKEQYTEMLVTKKTFLVKRAIWIEISNW